jgi:hypothetical protein
MVSEKARTIANGLHAESAKFITALIDVPPDNSSDEPRLIGTGWFLEDNAHGRIVTARHVVTEARDIARIGFSRDNGAKCVRPKGDWTLPTQSVDLACATLWPGALDCCPKSILPKARLAQSSDQVENDVLFVHGFPGRKSFAIASGLMLKSHGLATAILLPPLENSFSPRFLIAYSSDGIHKSDGSPGDCPEPRGMSGSPVWRANWTGNPSTWNAGMATVVGVAVEWSQEYPALVVEPIETLNAFLSGT